MGLKSTQYGPRVDMWGAGVVLFILLGGYPPFYSESEPALFEQIRKGHFSFEDPVWKGITNRRVCGRAPLQQPAGRAFRKGSGGLGGPREQPPPHLPPPTTRLCFPPSGGSLAPSCP